MPIRTALLVIAGLAGAAIAQTSTELTRTVAGQTVTSAALPAAILKFSDAFRYAGGQRFELYGVAVAEQHFFVDADPQKNVKRLFWLQFEEYLPTNDKTYGYKMPRSTDVGPLTFLYDSRVFTDYAAAIPRPDSDSSRMRDLFAKTGYKFPQTGAMVRLVHLPGTNRRSELMMIYIEAVPAENLPAGATNGMPVDDKPEWAAKLIQNANQNLTIQLKN